MNSTARRGFESLPVDVGGMIFDFLHILEYWILANASVSSYSFFKNALLRPRSKPKVFVPLLTSHEDLNLQWRQRKMVFKRGRVFEEAKFADSLPRDVGFPVFSLDYLCSTQLVGTLVSLHVCYEFCFRSFSPDAYDIKHFSRNFSALKSLRSVSLYVCATPSLSSTHNMVFEILRGWSFVDVVNLELEVESVCRKLVSAICRCICIKSLQIYVHDTCKPSDIQVSCSGLQLLCQTINSSLEALIVNIYWIGTDVTGTKIWRRLGDSFVKTLIARTVMKSSIICDFPQFLYKFGCKRLCDPIVID